MPTEDELRHLLQGEPGGNPRLDADRIIRRARARRRPKRIALAALGGLAAVAVVVPVALGLASTNPLSPMAASDEAGSAVAGPESAEHDGAGDASAHDDRVLRQDLPASCEPPLGEGEPAPPGVELQLAQPVTGGAITLTLVNGSTERLTGSIPSSPALLLARDGVIIGDSSAGVDLAAVDLAAGERLSLTLPLEAVDCVGEPLAAGGYEADALLAIRDDAGRTMIVESAFTPIVVGAAG